MIAEEAHGARELALLFCVVTGLQWAKACITAETVRAMAIRGLIERYRAAGLAPTKQRRAVLSLQHFDCSQCGAFALCPNGPERK